MDIMIQIISCTIGTLGFALFFNIKRDKVIPVTIGGFFTICIYLITLNYSNSIFISNLIGSIFITAYSEVLARILKCPTTVLLLPGIIPLVPGGSLFYTMDSAVFGKAEELNYYATQTVQVLLGLAVGIIVISVFAYHVNRLIQKNKKLIPNSKQL